MILSVIILSFNTKKILADCLTSLNHSLKADGLDDQTEVIVVDNNSQDGSAQMVIKNFPRVKLVRNSKNVGFGRANNQAVARSRGRFLLLLNSDTLIEKGNIKKLINYLQFHKECGVVGPKLLNLDGTDQPSAGTFPHLWISFLMLFGERFGMGKKVRSAYDRIREVDWIMGAAMLFRREVYNQAKGFDPKMFMYMEEIELCYRIRQAGQEIHYYPAAKIIHLGGASSHTGRKEPIWHIYRGLRYFYQKHYSVLALLGLRGMLKLKAMMAFGWGLITHNNYLIETYAEAYRLA